MNNLPFLPELAYDEKQFFTINVILDIIWININNFKLLNS